MAYTKNSTWNTGDVITSTGLNHLETQYDEAEADLASKMAASTGHKHRGTTGDGPTLPSSSVFKTGVAGSGTINFAGPSNSTITHNKSYIPVVQIAVSSAGWGNTYGFYVFLKSASTTKFVIRNALSTTQAITANYWYW